MTIAFFAIAPSVVLAFIMTPAIISSNASASIISPVKSLVLSCRMQNANYLPSVRTFHY